MHIAFEEGCRFDEGRVDDAVNKILSLSQGDMRRAVTMLQSAHLLSGSREGDAIKKDSIAKMAGLPPPALIDGLIKVLCVRKFDGMQEYVQNIVLEGYLAEYMLSALMAKIVVLDGVSDQVKAIISIKVAKADKKLIDGSDETLQLLALCSIALEQFKKRN